MWIPAACIRAAVAGPTPWNFVTGSAATNASPSPGWIANWPSGLFCSEASLARNLLYDTPAEAVSPVTSRMRARIARAVAQAVGSPARLAVTSR